MAKKSVIFIINPFSGIGRQKHIEQIFNDHLDKNQFDYEICYSEYPGHMEMLASEAVARGTDILVSVGGDGSINETFKAVKGSTSVLAIIPTGSGNGLARHLKIPLDPASAIALINQGKTKNIDTAEINGIPFASIAGIFFSIVSTSPSEADFFSTTSLVLMNSRPTRKDGDSLLIFGYA